MRVAERHVATFKSGVEASFAEFDRGLSGLATKAAGLGTVFAGLAGGWGLKVAAENEQAQMSFEVLLGSASEGQKVFADLQKFATDTAFDLKSATQAANQLFNAGAKSGELLPLLRIIGDQASASSQGLNEGTKQITKALADIKAKGKLSAQELNQLAEAGVGGRGMLAKKLGITTQEVMKIAETTGIDAGTAIQAILEGMQARTAGLMDRQAKTLQGRWDSLKETAAQTLGTIADELVRAFNIKGGLANATEWLQSLRDGAKETAQAIARVVGPIMDIAGAIKDVMVLLGDAVATKIRAAVADPFTQGQAASRSWRDTAVSAFENVVGTVATTADMIALIFDSIATGFTKVVEYVKAGAKEIMAQGQALAASASVLEDTIAMHKANEAAWRAEAQAHREAANAAQRGFDARQRATFQGRGHYGQQVRDFFGKAREQAAAEQARREAEAAARAKADAEAAAQRGQKVDPNSLPFAARDVRSLAESVNGLSKAWVLAAQNARQVAENLKKQGEAVAADTNPIFKLNEEIKRLNGLLDQNAITFDEYLASLGKAGEELIRAAEMPEAKSPAAMLKGSQDAYSILVQRDVRGTAQDRMAAAMERVKELMDKQERNGERMLQELKRLNLPAVANIAG